MMDDKKYSKYLNMVYKLFPVILLLYPLRHIFVGAEWWDTGYNYGNFMFMEQMDPMWLFGTFLGTALGNLFTKLPFGHTMVGLNVYTGLMVSLLAIAGYVFFTRMVGIPKWITFWGEMLAISFCWCPTALLYNYLTYVLMTGGVILLYLALTTEGKRSSGFFVFAGIFLGVNVFVRFPNLAEMALIVAVWAMGIIRREKPRKVVSQTLYCILGYVIGLLVCFGVISLVYGPMEYINGIQRLLSMPSEAGEYTLYSMVVYQLRNYLQNFIWLGYFVLMIVVCLIGYLLFPGKLAILKRIATAGVFLVGLKLLFGLNMFNFKYSTKMSAFQWGVFLLTATLFIGLVVILIWGKHFSEKEKLLAGLAVIIIVITPLGSNNHLYSSINNLFLVAPYTLWMLLRFLKWLPEKVKIFSLEPVKSIILLMLLTITFQGVAFGWVYVFSEGDGGENLHTNIENNDILKGIQTSPDRAKLLSEISAYVEEQQLKGKKVILYGQIPAMSYYLEMPFVTTAWPDLKSYNLSVMEADMNKLKQEVAAGGEAPVILLESGLKEDLQSTDDAKLGLIVDFMDEFAYELCFENEKFLMFRSGNP